MKLFYVNGKKMQENKNNFFDKYFTKQEIAKSLFQKAKEIISKYENTEKYTWLEPSVGEGCFFDLLPKTKRIGIDIDPLRDDIVKSDYLKYKLPNKPLIVIGNPPFGHRGVLAFEFIKHSENADFICFILPMFFESNGKGSIKYRIKNKYLLYSSEVPINAFYDENKRDVNVNCVFQIWSKKEYIKNEEFNWYTYAKKNPFGEYIEVVTVSLAKKRECGLNYIKNEKADFYISSTFYKKNEIVFDFKNVKYKSGIAIIIKNNKYKDKIIKIFKNVDWIKYSSLATNSCRHVGKSHIYKIMHDNNFNVKDV